MRRLGLVLGAMVVVLVSGVAAASVLAGSNSSPSPVAGLHLDRNEGSAHAEDAGVHGGPIDRFHGSGCGLTSVSSLTGNWTHGDYVSAVAMATGDSTMIVQAAQSDCGKPMVAMNHGGPPAHARAAIEEHASAQALAAIEEHASRHAAAAAGPPTPGS